MVYFFDSIGELGNTSLTLELFDGFGASRHVEVVLVAFFSFLLAHSSSEEIFVFLLGEIDIIVTMWVRELCWIVSVILVQGV